MAASEPAHEGPQLFEALEQAGPYPYEPEAITHVQTHISHVFIAPPYVYKFKKPVDLGFLDFSTPARRRHFCEREVELNRRLCAGIYCGVVPVTKDQDGYHLEGSEGTGEVVEHAVKMKKLEERWFLHTFIEEDSLQRRHLQRLADTLAGFYNGQDPDASVAEYGTPDSIRYNTDENFEQTRAFVGHTITKPAYRAIRRYTDRYLEARHALLQRRVDEGHIVDGHGDLHLEHIHMTPDTVCIYDCIEFNERFRCGDVAADLAFLAMDLDFLGRWQDERYFVQLMTDKLDDPALPELIDFYKCYRAYVKGKVKSMQAAEEEVPAADREQARDKAARYFRLALRYALLGSGPAVLAFAGGVATGKSTLARRLAEDTALPCYNSDRLRKQMAGLPPQERTPADRRAELYSEEMSQRTYEQLLAKAQMHLQQQESVIVDATFSDPETRRKLHALAREQGGRCLFIETTVPEGVVRDRLRERGQARDVVSDARLEDFEMLQERYRPPRDADEDSLIRIGTDRPLPDTLTELYTTLAARQAGRQH